MLRILQTSRRICYLDRLRPKASLICSKRCPSIFSSAETLFCEAEFLSLKSLVSVRNLASYPLVPRMSDKVIVRRRVEEGRFTFSFHLKITDLKIDKQFNLSREVTEDTSAFIERLSSNIVKANKKNKGQGEGRLVPKFTLSDDAVVVNGETHRTVADFLFTKGLCMMIDSKKFLVAVNPPMVTELKMSEVVVAGLLIYPHKLEVEFADQEATEVEWFASEKVPEDLIEKGAKQNKKAKVEAEDAIEWTRVGKGRLFTPGQEHVQCRLRCQVTPYCGPEPGVAQSAISAPVTLGPGELPVNSRHMWTSTPQTWPNMRLVTYNILADLYCDSDFSRTVLHPSCPPYALHIDYRVKLVLHELLGYNSDLVCLQEVDKKVFENHLEPVLSTANLEGQFAKKGGQVSEGLAIFWRKDRLQLIEFSSVFLPSLLQSPPYAYLWDKLKDNPALVESLTQRTTELAIAVLRVNTGRDEHRLLVVGNTHLYFKPDADHVRLIQAELCRRELERVKGEILVRHPDAKVSMVLCGDFNSTPEYDNHMGGVLQLMTQGKVDENHLDWRSREGEEVKGISLDSKTLFFSAAGTPKYTNYTEGFKDCLDYIYMEEGSAIVEQVVPFPTEEELELHTAIPSIVLPSDHIAVVVDRKDTGRMPPKKGGRRRKKVEDSDEEEEVVPARRGSSKRDEDYVWEEDQCEEADVESSKKGRRKKKSVVWNDNDCRADVCLRPPGTSRWVCCDACSGWFHVPCLFLPEEQMALLDTEKEYYCPHCVQDKIKEFDALRTRLSLKVEGLATVQSEFGGVTIPREMFEEKKNATTYNYTKEFPPTLRDLVARLGDFKYDYQQMVARLGPLLKAEHEGRLTYIQWQLDEIAEQVLKPETPEQEEVEEEEDVEEEEEVEEDEEETGSQVDGQPQLEFDLEWVKQEQQQQGRGSSAISCQHCAGSLSPTACYSCVRQHLVCVPCRSLLPGCVCPICVEQTGDRRRLFQGTRGKRRRKEDSKEALISLGLSKRKVPVEDVSSPQIMRVWSCTEENTLAVQPPLGEITLEGPIVKQEPGERQAQRQESHTVGREEERGESINMSTVLSKSMMSQQLLDLIDNTLNGGVRVVEEEQESSEEQQPTNYNDTEALAEQEVAKIQSPMLVSSKEKALMSAREKLSSMMMMPHSAALEAEMAKVRQRIEVLRKEVLVEEEELNGQHQQVLDPWTDQPLVQQRQQHLEEDVLDQHEVLDPWTALQRLKTTERRTSFEEMRRASIEGTTIRRSSMESEEMQDSWREFKEKAQQAKPGPSNVGSLTVAHPIQSLPPAPPLKRAPHHPALRGCRFEPLESFRDQRFDGRLTFSLLKNYSGTALEWRSFLQLGQSRTPGIGKFTLQLGRSAQVFYLRGVGDEGGHAWHLHILQTPQAEAVDVRGKFGNPGSPHVLPYDIQSGDVRDYQLHLTLASV